VRTARRALTGVVAALVAACVAPIGIRGDELECEEAVARLTTCCPGFDPGKVECAYVDRGCDPPILPAFSVETAQCIERSDCVALAARGTCALAQPARKDTTKQLQGICP
jgi:hypothetical protein